MFLVRRLILRPASESIDDDEKEDMEITDATSPDNFTEQVITESIDNVDLTNLDTIEEQNESAGELSQVDDEEEEDKSTIEEESCEYDIRSVGGNDGLHNFF